MSAVENTAGIERAVVGSLAAYRSSERHSGTISAQCMDTYREYIALNEI